MNKQDIIAFFDERAASWDQAMKVNEGVIEGILDQAGVFEGKRVMDVACGTGVLVPFFLKRNIKAATCVDIAPRMIAAAKEKFSDLRIAFLAEDIETLPFSEPYDAIVVYNALPHFGNPQGLIATLAGHLAKGGRLTIAHGASRETINGRHQGAASRISMGLMHQDELAALMGPWVQVDKALSDETRYLVSGIKK